MHEGRGEPQRHPRRARGLASPAARRTCGIVGRGQGARGVARIRQGPGVGRPPVHRRARPGRADGLAQATADAPLHREQGRLLTAGERREPVRHVVGQEEARASVIGHPSPQAPPPPLPEAQREPQEAPDPLAPRRRRQPHVAPSAPAGPGVPLRASTREPSAAAAGSAARKPVKRARPVAHRSFAPSGPPTRSPTAKRAGA